MQDARLSPSGAAVRPALGTKVYRRPASPEETARRQEWGRWWGKETKRVYDELLKGMG